MSVHKRIKLFGEQAVSAMFKELKQLNDSVLSGKLVIEPILFNFMFMIDAYKERDVAVVDIPGAYLHAGFPPDKRVILKLREVFVDTVAK